MNKRKASIRTFLLLSASTILLAACGNNGSSSTSTPSVPGTSVPGTSIPGTSTPGTSNPGTSDPGTSSPGSSSSVPVSKYTVTFNANGHGTAPDAQIIEEGKKASEPTALTAEGYTFHGWYKEAACTNKWDFAVDTVTADTTLYAKWVEILTGITALHIDATSKHRTDFPKGTPFSYEGLVINVTLEDNTTKIVTEDYYTVDSSEFNKDVLGKYSIRVKLIEDTNIMWAYSVNVTAAALVSLALATDSAHQTSFVKSEAFTSSGIKVKGVFSDETTVAMASDEYTIDSSAYKADTNGTYSIVIKAVSDPTILVKYDVKVGDLPLVGEYFTFDENEGITYDMVAFGFKIDAAGKRYSYKGDGLYSETGSQATISRDASGKLVLTVEGIQMVYDPTADTISIGTTVYHRFVSTKYVKLSADFYGQKMYIVIAKGGSISAATLAFISALSLNLYTKEAGGNENLVTASTKFSADTTLYLLAPEVDYSGLPFVGNFVRKGENRLSVNLASDGKATFYDSIPEAKMPYTATKSGDDYELSLMGEKFVYDVSGKSLALADKPSEIMYTQVASDAIIVTLTAGATLDESYTKTLPGKYVVTKGEAFDLILKQYRAKLVLKGYTEGTAINASATYEITDVIASEVYLPSGSKIGTFMKGYFIFDSETGAVTYQKGTAAAIQGTYVLKDLTVNSLTYELTLSGSKITAVYNGNTLTIASGVYEGSYTEGAFLKGLPFVGTFTTEAGTDSVIINEDGTMNTLIQMSMEDGEIAITSIVGSLYILNFVTVNQETKEETITEFTIDMSAKVLTYKDVAYKGNKYMGEPFVGTYVYQGKVISIFDDGSVVTPDGSGSITEVIGAEDALVLNLTMDGDGGSKSITYSEIDGSIDWETKVYVPAVMMDASALKFQYSMYVFKAGESSWTFDMYGFVFIDEVCIGRASELTDTGFVLTLNDKTVKNITVSLTEGVYSFAYNDVTYSYTIPLTYGLAFLGVLFTNDEANAWILFSDEDKLTFKKAGTTLEGTVTAVTKTDETVTVSVKYADSTTGEWVYSIAERTFTNGGLVYIV